MEVEHVNWVRRKIDEALDDPKFRSDYVATALRRNIAHQIRAMRDARGWNQAELGKKAGKLQSNISRIEDPDYGRVSLQTLIDVAEAFDVGLLVRFVSFSELLEQTADLSLEALNAPSYADDKFHLAKSAEQGDRGIAEAFASATAQRRQNIEQQPNVYSAASIAARQTTSTENAANINVPPFALGHALNAARAMRQ